MCFLYLYLVHYLLFKEETYYLSKKMYTARSQSVFFTFLSLISEFFKFFLNADFLFEGRNTLYIYEI